MLVRGPFAEPGGGNVGFAPGWLLTEPSNASVLTAFAIAVAAALVAWVLTRLVFRTTLFFIGAIAGGVIGAKLFGLLEQGNGNVVVAALFVMAAAFIVGLATQRFRRPVLIVACALGGAGLALSGLARTVPPHWASCVSPGKLAGIRHGRGVAGVGGGWLGGPNQGATRCEPIRLI